MGSLMTYILDDHKQNVKTYKYKGSDVSILYKYVTSPICDVISMFIPEFIT